MRWFCRIRLSASNTTTGLKRFAHSGTLILRPYQESCLDACVEALKSGSTRIGVSLPMGSGKTTVFVSLLSRILPPTENATRSLIVVNSIELARQAAAQVKQQFPEWTVELEQGLQHKASGNADVTVATYQTLLRSQRIHKFSPTGLKAIIIDEAHHAAAPSYRRLLSHFDPEVKNPDKTFETPIIPHRIPIVGFSATFSRHDGLALGSVFERIVYHRDFLDMIKEEWLCNVRFTSVRANINLKQVTINSVTGDFNPTSLAQIINTETINNLVVQTWLDRARTRKSTLVFCVNLSHVRELTQAFRGYGVDARYIYSKTPAAEREKLITSFKAGGFPVLVNCAILTEGADIPNIDCVVVARPTRSRNIFAQMIGRGMRLSPGTGKVDCRIIDFVDSTSRIAGVVSTPTLFGFDPSEMDIDDETMESLEKKVAERASKSGGGGGRVPEPNSVTYTDYENPFDLVDHASGAPNIANLSTFAWVGCGADMYILECLGKGYIRVDYVPASDDEDEHYRSVYTPAAVDRRTANAFKMSPFFRSRKVLTARTLGDAIRGSDTYAKTKVVFGPMAAGLLRTARWRRDPATEHQKAFIANRFGKHMGVLGDVASTRTTSTEKLTSLSKGQAANIISRLKHGAQARYEKKAKAEAKRAHLAAKEQLRIARESTSVGPLIH